MRDRATISRAILIAATASQFIVTVDAVLQGDNYGPQPNTKKGKQKKYKGRK